MSAELIHQMYIAYYQRPADPAGLIYWQDQLNTNGGGETGWNAVAAAFANAAESSALYGNQTLGQKISAIYLAAFERAASADEVTVRALNKVDFPTFGKPTIPHLKPIYAPIYFYHKNHFDY